MFKMKGEMTNALTGEAEYSVIFDHSYTVKSFIDTVVENKPGEWGYITVGSSGRCYYNNQKVISNTIPPNVLEKRIKNARARGKWWQMDYEITLQDGPVKHESFDQT